MLASGAREVEQVPFAVVDLFEIGIVLDILDAHLHWDGLVVEAMTATARNSRPFVRSMVPVGELA
jgi:hypothetical protein